MGVAAGARVRIRSMEVFRVTTEEDLKAKEEATAMAEHPGLKCRHILLPD